jgi:putative transposase
MLKAYKYRIMPTKAQAELINKHIGSCRFVYNLALETKQTAYAGNKINLDCFDLIKQLPDLKKECEWLKEINSQSLQQSITHLDCAFTRFFKGQADFPNFKKKSTRQSFSVPQNIIVDFENNKLIIPKFKRGIDIILHRQFKGTIKQATISKTPTGKYFASILVENNQVIPNKANIELNSTIGIDLGLKSFLITSEGDIFNNPRYLNNAQSKLKYIQSKYSKYNGKRTKHKLAIVHETIANQRLDFLQKLSTKLISENQTICLEDLSIQGMSTRCKPKQDKNGTYLPNGQSAKSGLNKSISDVSWSTFVEMLKYKAEWQGKNIIQIGRFEPSSKTCNICGTINKELMLKDRVWTCKHCSTIHDRDINAAINIKNFALRNSNNKMSVERRQENHSELPTLVGVLTYEAHKSLACG